MANERLSVFGDTDDVDLTAFMPERESRKLKPAREKVRAVTEAAKFPSREGTPPVSTPLKRPPRYHKTGRTAQLNCRVMPATHDKIYAIADQQGWLVGQTIERALEALDRELEKGEGEESCYFLPKTTHSLRQLSRPLHRR
jgi:hypothetical protein